MGLRPRLSIAVATSLVLLASPVRSAPPSPQTVRTELAAIVDASAEEIEVRTTFHVAPNGADSLVVVLTAFTLLDRPTFEVLLDGDPQAPLELREAAPARWMGELAIPVGTSRRETFPLTLVQRMPRSRLEHRGNPSDLLLSLPRLDTGLAAGEASFTGVVELRGETRLRRAFPAQGRWNESTSSLELELPAAPGQVRLLLADENASALDSHLLVDLVVVGLLAVVALSFLRRLPKPNALPS